MPPPTKNAFGFALTSPFDFEFFFRVPTRMVNIFVKFYLNSSTKYRDIAPREINANGWSDGIPENTCLSSPIVGSKYIKIAVFDVLQSRFCMKLRGCVSVMSAFLPLEKCGESVLRPRLTADQHQLSCS